MILAAVVVYGLGFWLTAFVVGTDPDWDDQPLRAVLITTLWPVFYLFRAAHWLGVACRK